MSHLIYLACPYRHPDPAVQKKRCAAAHYVAAQCFAKGLHLFSPLTHNEFLIHILQDGLPKERWLEFDLSILRLCQELFVLTLEGWETSYGVQKEIAIATELNIPITKVSPPDEALFTPFIR